MVEDFNINFTKIIEPLNPIGINGNESIIEIFENRLKELSITKTQALELLVIDSNTLDPVLDKTAKRVDVATALKISSFLNLSIEDFFKIYIKDLSAEKIGELEKVKKANFIVSNFDLKNLKKVNFIKTIKLSNLETIEERIIKFFGFDNIYNYKGANIGVAFSRTKRSSGDLMREFWINSAFAHFESINNPYSYNRDILLDLLPKIKPYTRNIESGLLNVIKALYHVGVTVIYQPYLPTMQVRGATFLINNKPCIVLTDFRENYPTIWFALIHELHHVLFDLEEIQKRTYHLTGEVDLFLMHEEAANDFAGEYLFSKEKRKYIESFINDEYIVNEFAKSSQIHPSFIYDFYMKDKNAYATIYGKYNKYYPNVKNCIKAINTNVWQLETIEESVKILKEEVFSI